MAKGSKIGRGAEESGVAGDAADGEGVFVVDLALHQAVPQIVINLCRRNPRPKFFGRAEHGVFHGERREDISLCEVVERAPGESLDDFRHEDDAEIGINFLCSRLVFQWLGEDFRERVLFAL